MHTFEWDDDKNKLNLEKHKLSFDAVSQLFIKPLRLLLEKLIKLE